MQLEEDSLPPSVGAGVWPLCGAEHPAARAAAALGAPALHRGQGTTGALHLSPGLMEAGRKDPQCQPSRPTVPNPIFCPLKHPTLNKMFPRFAGPSPRVLPRSPGASRPVGHLLLGAAASAFSSSWSSRTRLSSGKGRWRYRC